MRGDEFGNHYEVTTVIKVEVAGPELSVCSVGGMRWAYLGDRLDMDWVREVRSEGQLYFCLEHLGGEWCFPLR